MEVISYNQYLKLALNEILYSDVNFKESNSKTLIIDLTSFFNLNEIHWNAYDKVIVVTDDNSDVYLFNNAKIYFPVHYIQLNNTKEVFFKSLSHALKSPGGQPFKKMLEYRNALLTKQQHAVLTLTAKGLSLHQISLVLGLPSKNISGYRSSGLKRVNKRLSAITFSKLNVLTINQGLDERYELPEC